METSLLTNILSLFTPSMVWGCSIGFVLGVTLVVWATRASVNWKLGILVWTVIGVVEFSIVIGLLAIARGILLTYFR